MIPKECKRLAEVDFPIAEVGRYALAEKARRMGTPHQLHLWWAWRPLASSRAVLMALLLPDPCDEHCPAYFKKQAREILGEVRQPPKNDEDLQKALLWFIGSFANWDMSPNPVYLKVARNIVRAAHPEETPLVVDPFAGGGSIPLEALRLSCDVFASDLNPVAGLILKSKLDDIQRFGPELPDELVRVGDEVKAVAEKELADLYPVDPDGSITIAYLWARTVRCESPNCGAEIPLLRSLWLCTKLNRKRALRTKVLRPRGRPPQVEFEIFEPIDKKEVGPCTVSNAKASCLCCGTVLLADLVRAQLRAEGGGADAIFDANGNRTGGARMTAVVTLRPGERGRHYRLPTDADYEAVSRAQARLEEILMAWERGGKQGLCPVPDETLPLMSGTFNAPIYGMSTWGSIYTSRQALSFVSLSRIIREKLEKDEVPSELAAILAMICSKLADRCNSLVNWSLGVECPDHLFKSNAVPMGWDFAESNMLSSASGSIASIIKTLAMNAKSVLIPDASPTSPTLADATDSPLPDQSAHVWFTDPPYYFAVPYADLSDFFFVWLKRTLPDHPLLRDPFDKTNELTPKGPELCEMKHWDPVRYKHKDQQFFEDGMAAAFLEGRRLLREDGIGCVVFAHKTTEGWEALLSGIIRGGLVITASWPIATERAARMRARNSAALETSVHLICRPRPEDAPVGDWADVLRELPPRVAGWMERLQGEGIRGADLVFACIGPALEIFSRYRAVETAEGREVGLAEYLKKVWEVVGHSALKQVLGNDDSNPGELEEDARLTALFLWTLQSTKAPNENGKKKKEDEEEADAKVAAKGFSLPFDMVRRFAQPMGIDLDVWTDRIIVQDKGVVRLLPVAERVKALFGDDGARAAEDWLESDTGGDLQGILFPNMEATTKKKARTRGKKAILSGDGEIQSLEATTLDRVHAAMLLQASGQASALRKLLKTEQDRGPDFLRLGNALSALYPTGCEEKRLLDAMLLAVPR